jgi:hypothetical protein
MPKIGLSKADYPVVTIYQPIAGWKAVQYWWNPEMGGFPEPWQTASVAYGEPEPARDDAMRWAVAEKCSFQDDRDGKVYSWEEVERMLSKEK